MNESRIKKSLLNARVNFVFYFITLIISFFSRRVFLNTLGVDFIGLNGTLDNILGMLSLAELGIGASISFHLYKPIREEKYEQICDLISLFGWLYRIIGSIIFSAAIVVSLFFPVLFSNVSIDIYLIYFCFYCLLGSSLIGYFINYRQILLSADQRGYVVAVYLQGAAVVKTLLQMYLCSVYLNYYLWAGIEFGFSIIACLLLNWKIKATYPWLNSKPKLGKALYKKYPTVIRSVKQIFVHRIKDFILTQSDQILIFAFVSLKYVAYYGNYTLLIMKITVLFRSVMGSADAGIGNLVAENNKEKSLNVFWELIAMRYWIAGIIILILYFTIPPFIALWLGEEYLLSETILFLICVNLYISMTRTVVDAFNHSHGLYADVWSAWAEGLINLTVTFIVASQFGLIGILIGKIASLLPIVVIWKPLYLFLEGFKEKYVIYWKHVGRHLFFLSTTILLSFYLNSICPFHPSESWIEFVYYCFYIAIIVFLTYTTFMLCCSNDLKGFLFRLSKKNKNSII